MKDKQFRNYLLTINNPEQTDEELKKYIEELPNLKYCVFQREKGAKGTEHIQMYIEYTNSKKFSTVKNQFPKAHIENRKGTKKQARDYCMKKQSRINEPIEIGTFVDNGQRTDLEDILNMIKNGATDIDIMDSYPTQYMRYTSSIEKARQKYLDDKFSDIWRDLKVTYIYGSAGTGKSRYIMEKYGYKNVYRVTEYKKHPFDNYMGQDVIVFEEFRSSLPVQMMLNYLDGYPLQLPARYQHKTACFTKVYFSTNVSFDKQYEYIRENHPETYKAWERRIHSIINFDKQKDIIDDLDVCNDTTEEKPF